MKIDFNLDITARTTSFRLLYVRVSLFIGPRFLLCIFSISIWFSVDVYVVREEERSRRMGADWEL